MDRRRRSARGRLQPLMRRPTPPRGMRRRRSRRVRASGRHTLRSCVSSLPRTSFDRCVRMESAVPWKPLRPPRPALGARGDSTRHFPGIPTTSHRPAPGYSPHSWGPGQEEVRHAGRRSEEGVAGESRLYTGRFLEGVFMRIPRMLKHGRLWFTGPLAVLIVATAGSQVGSGQQTVPFREWNPGGSSWARRPSAPEQAGRLRHGRRTRTSASSW